MGTRIKIEDPEVVCSFCRAPIEVEPELINLGKNADRERGFQMGFSIIKSCKCSDNAYEYPERHDHNLDDKVFSWLAANYRKYQPEVKLYDPSVELGTHTCFSGENDFMPKEGAFGLGYYCSLCGNFESISSPL